MHFKNKTIWITGASTGIGAELAKQLADTDVTLILTARDEQKLKTIAGIATGRGAICHILSADLYKSEVIEQLVLDAISLTGKIDVVIHSAGISQRSLATETSSDVYRQLMEINFFAPVQVNHYLLPHFLKNSSGHIVVLSSMAGLMGFPMRSGYAAAKHALKGFFETLQAELWQSGIYVSIVYPGRIRTSISVTAVTGNGTPHGKMDEGQLNGISVDICAQRIIDGIKRNKKRIIIAKGERLLWWIWWYWHSLYYKIAHKKGITNTEPRK